MEGNVSKILAGSLVEGDLDLEIGGLQAGDGRRGSNASQSNVCCMDPAFLQKFDTSGSRLGQTAAFTPPEGVGKDQSHQHMFPKEKQQQKKEEKKMTRSRRNQRAVKMDRQHQEVPMKVPGWLSF